MHQDLEGYYLRRGSPRNRGIVMNAIDLRRLGDQYEEHGDYESAELLFRKSLALLELEYGEEHPSIAMDLYNLGLLCHSLGKFDDAETMLMRAWSIERTCFGPMHPETLATLEALSDIYYDANRNVEIEYRSLTPAKNHSSWKTATHVYH
jgi:tetratricopeptide (TPR) repeat protein